MVRREPSDSFNGHLPESTSKHVFYFDTDSSNLFDLMETGRFESWPPLMQPKPRQSNEWNAWTAVKFNV